MLVKRLLSSLIIGSFLILLAQPSLASPEKCGFVPGGTGNCESKSERSSKSPPRNDSENATNHGTSSKGGGGGDGCARSDRDGVQSTVCFNPGGGSPQQQAAPPPPSVTQRDFQAFAIPPAVPHAWPTNWGVAQRRTAFWADSSIRTLNVTLLGQPVAIRATPIAYTWNFGDGTTKKTTTPGSRPSSLDRASIYHVYTKPGRVTVRLSTTYTGQFSVAGGAWQDIPGTAAVSSQPLNITIYRHHKYLAQDDCLTKPTASDCTPTTPG